MQAAHALHLLLCSALGVLFTCLGQTLASLPQAAQPELYSKGEASLLSGNNQGFFNVSSLREKGSSGTSVMLVAG